MTKFKYRNGDEWVDMALEFYPIGSIYMSYENISPGQLFGGTWIAIEGRMLIGADATYIAGSKGGSATTTIASTNLPKHVHSVGAHSHGLNGHTHSVGAHSHGLNSHKHTYDKADSPSGSTTLTTDQIPSHSHKPHTWAVILSSGGGSGRMEAEWTSGANLNTFNDDSDKNRWSGSTGGGKGHTHTISTTSTNSGAASGSTANSSSFDTGGNSGNTANSTAFNTSDGNFSNIAMDTISPYEAVYIWRRTA